MALFGSRRDLSLILSLNRELINDVISQQIAFYKYNLKETKSNIYGEASKEKFFDGPTLVFCLINKEKQKHAHVEEGITYNRKLEVSFMVDELEDAEVFPEVGDVLLFEESFYEISGIVENQFFGGKNPKFINSDLNSDGSEVPHSNPYTPDLEKFGGSISIVCRANYIPADKLGINHHIERM